MITRNIGCFLGVCALVGALAPGAAQERPRYEKPPQAVLDVLNAPPTPQVSFSPTRRHMLLLEWSRYPSIAEVAQPVLGLAGERINPRTNGPQLLQPYTGFRLKAIPGGKERPIPTPKDARLGAPQWSPDGTRFAFSNTTATGIQVWVAEATSGETRRLPGVQLNAAYGTVLQWMPDSRTLLCQTIPLKRGAAPVANPVPAGPTIQESSGVKAPVRTFQDLLRDAHDEALFDYYFTSQLALVDATSGRARTVGLPGVYAAAEPSPDGQHLLVARIQRPYSYLVGAWAFPRVIEVWDKSGKREHRVAALPLADRVPIGGVATGPRSVEWIPTEPAALVWAEALDEGNPKKKVARRDVLRTLKAPFTAAPAELARTEHRYTSLTWVGIAGQALLSELDRDRRWRRTFLIDVRQPGASGRLIWDRSVQDLYGDPGTPLLQTLPNGQRVAFRDGDAIFLAGTGASPQGDLPFLDRFSLATLKSERLFQSAPGSYEAAVTLAASNGSRFITRRETLVEPPNYLLRSAGDMAQVPLTDFADPAPQLRRIKKQLVTYRRADGVPLSFTLYLPPNHKPGERLPTVVWAYPREFNDASTAGQVSGSPARFTALAGASHLFFLLQGYAVLDNATMPVVGDPETVNNTFLEQIVASARAAIEKATEMGVTDPKRVGVGGHSYGAFMTANLLAHSDLFRAGIARSGAYNRTLTPFGFQSERRTLWEAPEVYLKVSPFLHADKINEPLLILHGEADDNPGTFPIQSERLFHAVQGTGGVARYVTLPHESHGYAARESVEHTLHEMIAWFDRHVKNPSSEGAR